MDYYPVSTTSSSTIVFMNAGDYVYVAPSVSLLATDFGTAIYNSSYGTAQIYGNLVGGYTLYLSGASGKTSSILIGDSGIVSSLSGYNAVVVANGGYTVTNQGQIATTNGGDGFAAYNGAGTLTNYGTITSDTGAAVINTNSTTTDTAYVYNYGTIDSGKYGVEDYSGHGLLLYNYGTITGGSDALYEFDFANIHNSGSIDGAISLQASGSSLLNSGTIDGDVSLTGLGSETVNSSNGVITGTISCGSGGDTVTGGTTGGSIAGGSGNDILYANPTEAAVNNAAVTTLDGGAGKNALYGDGAYTTFLSGDTDGGYNQIWGELSQMSRRRRLRQQHPVLCGRDDGRLRRSRHQRRLCQFDGGPGLEGARDIRGFDRACPQCRRIGLWRSDPGRQWRRPDHRRRRRRQALRRDGRVEPGHLHLHRLCRQQHRARLRHDRRLQGRGRQDRRFGDGRQRRQSGDLDQRACRTPSMSSRPRASTTPAPISRSASTPQPPAACTPQTSCFEPLRRQTHAIAAAKFLQGADGGPLLNCDWPRTRLCASSPAFAIWSFVGARL